MPFSFFRRDWTAVWKETIFGGFMTGEWAVGNGHASGQTKILTSPPPGGKRGIK